MDTDHDLPESQPAPGETPSSEVEAPAPAPGAPSTPVGGLPDPALTPDPPDHEIPPVDPMEGHEGEPEKTGLQDPSAPHEAVQPTEGLGSRTPEETPEGAPTTQQGTETGPAPGPSPDQGGSYQP